MNNREIEKEIVNKGLTHPRVTPQDIESAIALELYVTGSELRAFTTPVLGSISDPYTPELWDDSLDCLTLCVLVLRNGFTVVGESACASSKNFDAELGRKIARQKAVDKMWPLLGYALKENINVQRLLESEVKDDTGEDKDL